jgi:hypothetical protein
MARILDGNSKKNPDPVKARKQFAMANVFRLLAQRAEAKTLGPGQTKNPANKPSSSESDVFGSQTD